jgi:rhodanese-related sulfurtransferase
VSIPHKSHNPGFLALVNEAKSQVKEIGVAEYQSLPRDGVGDGHVLIDVREDREWAEGHAAGAIHLSKGVIERDIESEIPDKSTKMVLYCGGGYRSALATLELQKMGYTNAISLDGGWRAWIQAGLPVEKP